MKKKILSIVAFLILSFFQILSQEVSVIPISISVDKGDEFTLNIEISNVADLYGFQIDIRYDPGVLEFIAANEGNFLNNNSEIDTFWIPPNSLTTGLIDNIACIRKGQVSGANGDGILVTITFKAIEGGLSEIILQNVILINSNSGHISFTISNGEVLVHPTITLISPNGGESLIVGSNHFITWTSTGTINNVMIEYSTNNGSSWSTITTSTSNYGSYSWPIPNTPSTQCLVRISDEDGSPSDTSDSTFSISDGSTHPILTITSPNGGEEWEVGSTQYITWNSTGSVGNVKIEYSINYGSSWSTIVPSTPNDGTYSWTIPNVVSSQCCVRISDVLSAVFDLSDSVFSIVSSSTPPQIFLNRTQLNFGAITSGSSTPSQSLFVDNSGGGTLKWSVSDDAIWLNCSPSSGLNAGSVTVSVDPAGLSAGTYTGAITVKDDNASNSPQTISVLFKVYESGQTSVPFGVFATPIDGSTVRSSIPVTGWVLDDVGVENVNICWKEGECTPEYSDYATLVEGARPDVEQAYTGYPMNYKAGWGYMLLTNNLPRGDGSYRILAIAKDVEGNEVIIGTKSIIVDNANAVKPFGAIDTPTQGGIASDSSFTNWGWVLTPQPNYIPYDGSTINVLLDGVRIGNPAYNLYRADIATLFPGYANTNGAVGYFSLDTTAYTNGVHTISWTAIDSGGNADGIGSRYFIIQNTGSSRSGSKIAVNNQWIPTINIEELSNLPVNYSEPIKIKNGYGRNIQPWIIQSDKENIFRIEIRELERIELHISNVEAGYMLAGNRTYPLPLGFTLDTKKGRFSWIPGPGFYGNYRLVFVVKDKYGVFSKKEILVTIVPKFGLNK